MSNYRKKPIVINATQWFQNGDHPDDAASFHGFETEGLVVRYFRHQDRTHGAMCLECGCVMGAHGWIDTREGGHRVCPGDWIITGVAGERYPCKPSIFALTYEAVE